MPTQPGEEESKDGPSNPVTREVIDLVCKTASITMKKDAIDVCHRIGNQGQGPIIIRFATKSARFDFVKQGNLKLRDISTADLDFTKMKVKGLKPAATPASTRSTNRSSMETAPGAPDTVAASPATSKIYLQEHLTKRSKDLLTETRATLHDTHQYYGYVKNGEIRVKIRENDYSVISCASDIQKELEKANSNGQG